ncbi:MAG: hypothetical protein ABR562_07425, partial [Thermoplasmatota archaeon]
NLSRPASDREVGHGVVRLYADGSMTIAARSKVQKLPRVVPSPGTLAKYECTAPACARRWLGKGTAPRVGAWCYHVDNARVYAGFTKMEEVRKALYIE